MHCDEMAWICPPTPVVWQASVRGLDRCIVDMSALWAM